MTPTKRAGNSTSRSGGGPGPSTPSSNRVASGRVKKPNTGTRTRPLTSARSRASPPSTEDKHHHNDDTHPLPTPRPATSHQDELTAAKTQRYEWLRRRQANKEKKKKTERKNREKEKTDIETATRNNATREYIESKRAELAAQQAHHRATATESQPGEKLDHKPADDDNKKKNDQQRRDEDKRDNETRDYIQAKRADQVADQTMPQQGASWKMLWSVYQRRSRNVITVGTLVWPVETGRMADVNANNIKRFYINCVLDDKLLAQELKKERNIWHPDSVQKKVGKLDKETMDKVTEVFQEVDALWGQLTGRPERSTGLKTGKI